MSGAHSSANGRDKDVMGEEVEGMSGSGASEEEHDAGSAIVRRIRLRSDVKRGMATMRPFPSVPLGQLVACSASLIFAGLLLARGFVGFRPGDPMVILFGVVLAVSATLGLSTDHVAVRAVPQRPRDVLTQELNRCRRHAHPMTLMAVRCNEDTSRRIVTRLRTTDHSWWTGPYFVALLPETDRAGAQQMADRISDLVEPANVALALFPEDGLTAQALLDRIAGPAQTSEPATLVKLTDELLAPPAPPTPDLNGPAQAEAG